MYLLDHIINALRTQAPALSESELQGLAHAIVQEIEQNDDLQQSPEELVAARLQPTVMLMLAQDHSSITNAAQYAVRVLINQVIDDPASTIPEHLRQPEYCPYPGLEAFQEQNAAFFYGREDEIDALLPLTNRALLAITGPSGVGKSSFVLAGVLPQLRYRVEHQGTLLAFRVRTTNDVLDEFATFLAARIGQPATHIVQNFRERDDALLTAMLSLSSNAQQRVFLVLDQFEELFVGEGKHQQQNRQRFLDNLLHAATHQTSAFLTILLTTRENFFEHEDYTSRQPLVNAIQRENFRLDPLSQQQLRQAIEQPLLAFNQQQQQDLRFQMGLVDSIVQDFRGPAISLPLVQYLLRLLWTEKHHLTHFAYTSLGKLEGVLDRHANGIYQGFDDDLKPLVNHILLSLIRPGIGGEYTRKRVRLEYLYPYDADKKQKRTVNAIVRQLANDRSRIVSQRGANDVVLVELTHEIILRQWETLRSLIESHRQRIQQREALLPQAEQWLSSRTSKKPDGNSDYLYRGSVLRKARQYTQDEQFNTDIDPRIQACFRVSKSRQRQMTVRWSVFAVFLLVVTLVGGYQLFTAESRVAGERERADEQATARALARQEADTNATAEVIQRRAADSQRLAELAQTEVDADPETALLLAYEAASLDHTPASEQALRDALDQLPFQSSILLEDSEISWAIFSPDGQHILVSFNDGTKQVIDISGNHVATIDSPSSSVEFSPNSQYIRLTLNTSDQAETQLWDLQGQHLATLQGTEAKFSPTGQYIFTRIDGEHSRLWDLTGNPIVDFNDIDPIMGPDEQYVLTSSYEDGVTLWNLDGQALQTFPGDHATLSSDGQYIVTWSNDNTSALWDITGQEIATIQGSDATFSPDSQHILTWADMTGLLWNIEGEQRSELEGEFMLSDQFKVEFSVDSQHIITSNTAGGVPELARLWDIDGHLIANLDRKVAYFSPNGKYIIAFERAPSEVELRDMNGDIIVTFKDVANWVFSPDGQFLLIISPGGRVTLWNIASTKMDVNADISVKVDGQMNNTHEQIHISPNGNYMLNILTDSTIALQDIDGNNIAILEGEAGVFSPDNQHVLTWKPADRIAGRGEMWLWNIDGRKLAKIESETDVIFEGITFSPDGQYFLTVDAEFTAVGSNLGPVRLWDLLGQEIAVLDGGAAIFSPNGKYIVTTDVSRTSSSAQDIRLWNLQGNLVTIIREAIRPPYSYSLRNEVTFSPDGQLIFIDSEHGVMKQHMLNIDDLRAAAACRVSQGLTEEEVAFFQVPTPLQLNLDERQCPPIFSWQ